MDKQGYATDPRIGREPRSEAISQTQPSSTVFETAEGLVTRLLRIREVLEKSHGRIENIPRSTGNDPKSDAARDDLVGRLKLATNIASDIDELSEMIARVLG